MPASFPTSVKSFSTKVDNDDINYAGHINDLQDEVAAIESILGTSPQGAAATVKARIAAVETGKSDTTHNHAHGTLTGLGNDDHPQYLLRAVATSKGDFLVHNGTSITRLPVGTNGQTLVADSAQPAGVRWASSTAITSATFTAKGELLVGTGAGTFVALAAGANGRVLVADSSTASGLAYSSSEPVLRDNFTAKGQIMVGTGNGTTGQRTVGADRSMLLGNAAQATGVGWGYNPILGGYSERVWTDAAATGTETINAAGYNVANFTLTGNVTLAFSNVPTDEAYSILLVLRQDATGGRTVTFPAGTKWQNGSPPSFTTTANAVNLVSLITVNGGAEWFGFLSGKGMA